MVVGLCVVVVVGAAVVVIAALVVVVGAAVVVIAALVVVVGAAVVVVAARVVVVAAAVVVVAGAAVVVASLVVGGEAVSPLSEQAAARIATTKVNTAGSASGMRPIRPDLFIRFSFTSM